MRMRSMVVIAWIIWFHASQANSAGQPLPEPSAVTLAENRLVALSNDGHIWTRGLKPIDNWRAVVIDPGALPNDPPVTSVNCAQDSSESCAISFSQNGVGHIGLLNLYSDHVDQLPLSNVNLELYATSAQIYYSKSSGPSVTYYSYDTNNYNSEPLIRTIGPVQIRTILASGRLIPIIYSPFQTGAIIDKGKIATLPPLPEGYVVTLHGIIKAEPFVDSTPAVQGHRLMTNLNLVILGDQVRLSDKKIASLDEHAQPLPETLASDAAEDLMAISAGKAGAPNSDNKRVNVFCQDADGNLVMKPILSLSEFQAANLYASRASDGFVLETYDAVHSRKFSVLELSGAGRGWSRRQCADTTLDVIDPDIVSEISLTEFTRDIRRTVSATGPGPDYEIVSPRDVAPKSVILDVYGAYGNQYAFPYVHSGTQAYIKENSLAMAHGVVRGDGDNGYDYAIASAAPFRSRAVDDVTTIALDIIRAHPEFKGHIIIRGQSAGAWLAVRTALARPDIFRGAIGISGVYEITKIHKNHRIDYFSEDDDLLRFLSTIKNGCNGQHFRIVHAADDQIAPVDLAQDFERALETKCCSAEMVTFAAGGHALDIQPADAEKRLHAYFQPF